MNIAFINPPFKPKYSRGSRSPAVTKSGTVYYPIWMALGAGFAEINGNNIFLVDAPAQCLDYQQTIDKLRDFKPALAVVETSTGSINNDAKFCLALKNAYPSIKICMVGNHVTALHEESLSEYTAVDFIARREYEETIVELAKVLSENEDLNTVKSLTWRNDGQIIANDLREPTTDLDRFPFVSAIFKRFVNIRDYFFAAGKFPQMMIYTGRGCPYQCTYCVYPQNYYGHKYRFRSARNIADEFKYIEENLPEVVEVNIEDDTFTVFKERTIEFCQMLIAQKNRLSWTCNVRADLDYETLKWMKKANCRLVIVGFESGSDTILKNVKKGLTIDKFKVAENARKAGILVHACFMFGNQGETLETMKETLKLAKKMNTDTAQFFPLMIYPGTEAYDWAKKEGLITVKSWDEWLTKDGFHNTVISTHDLTSEEIIEFCSYARKEYYLRVSYLWIKFLSIAKHPSELIRTLKAFKTFSHHLFSKQNSKMVGKFKK